MFIGYLFHRLSMAAHLSAAAVVNHNLTGTCYTSESAPAVALENGGLLIARALVSVTSFLLSPIDVVVYTGVHIQPGYDPFTARHCILSFPSCFDN